MARPIQLRTTGVRLSGDSFASRSILGLRMIADRRYATALEVGYGAGAVLLAIAAGVVTRTMGFAIRTRFPTRDFREVDPPSDEP